MGGLRGGERGWGVGVGSPDHPSPPPERYETKEWVDGVKNIQFSK